MQVLEAICDRLNFDAEAAAALHKQLYRQRLDSILGPKLVNGKGPEMIEGLGITGAVLLFFILCPDRLTCCILSAY